MIEKFLNNSRELLKQVDNFSNFKLKNRDDLQRFFSLSLNENNAKLFDDTIFTAKYVLGLMRVLKKGGTISEVKSLEHVKSDLTSNMEKVTAQIRELISEGNELDKNYFESNFLQMTPDAFQNLNKLLEDLEWTKEFFNDLKRR